MSDPKLEAGDQGGTTIRRASVKRFEATKAGCCGAKVPTVHRPPLPSKFRPDPADRPEVLGKDPEAAARRGCRRRAVGRRSQFQFGAETPVVPCAEVICLDCPSEYVIRR